MTRANPIPAKGYTGTQISETGPDTFGAVAGYLNDLLEAQITLHDSTIAERPSYLDGVSPAFWSYYNQANGVRTAYLWDGVRDVPILSVSTDGVLTISGLPFADLSDKSSSDKTVSPDWVSENVPGVAAPVSIPDGGTGGTTPAEARANLGIVAGISPVACGIINADGSIAYGSGITSVTRTGAGAYTINHASSNFANAIPVVTAINDNPTTSNQNFACVATPASKIQSKVQIFRHDATAIDGSFVFLVF